MTIYLYSGTPGSGKSLHATRDIRDKLRYAKNPVVANYNLSQNVKGRENFHYYSNDEMTPEVLQAVSRDWFSNHRFKEDAILLVLDECQLLFNSRDWGKHDRMDWLEFFSQHRKFGYKVIFIAQFDRMVDRQIRSLIEYEYIHRRLGNFGIKGKIMTLFTVGELFVCVKRFYPLKERVGVECFKAHRSIFRMYDSYATFGQTDGQPAGRGQGAPPSED
jgi:zona occludens toxin (predicted ATPase)